MDYINFIVTRKKFCLSLHYNGANSHLLFHGTELIKFKAKDSEIISTPLCLRIITKEISKNNTWLNDWKTGLNEYAYDFVIDFDAIAVADILDIRSYLMKKYEKETVRNSIKKTGFVKQIFVSAMMYFGCNLSSGNLLEFVSINNQEYKVRP